MCCHIDKSHVDRLGNGRGKGAKIVRGAIEEGLGRWGASEQ